MSSGSLLSALMLWRRLLLNAAREVRRVAGSMCGVYERGPAFNTAPAGAPIAIIQNSGGRNPHQEKRGGVGYKACPYSL